jgi:VCBS repeat-containing protein
MRLPKLTLVLPLLLCVLAGTRSQTADQILVAPGAVWRYNDSGTNLGTAWRAVSYNDGAWRTGPAQLGYGDGDEATVISYGSNANNRRITYYFRRSFTVANPAVFASLLVRFVRDDGAVIYLNGVEVARSNMPTGTINYLTRAVTAIGGADESAWQEVPVDPSRLVTGTNVIAVEVHQQSPTSTDVSFNLELRGAEAQAQVPAVSLLSPADHGVTNVANVTFTASAAASAGLSSATLFIGDAPKTAVFSGPGQIDDAQVVADTPTVSDGGALSLNVDGQTPHAHALMKFPSLVGASAGQVPAGAAITSATLQVNCTNAGQAMRLYRVTESWNETEATWNERSAGVPWTSPGADGAGSNAGVSVNGDCTVAGQRSIDITQFVQEWSSGAPNHGVVLIDSGTDGVDFDSSESSISPVLTVVYKTGLQAIETKSIAGQSAQVSFSTTVTLGRAYLWNVRVTDAGGQQSWAPSDFELIANAAAPDQPLLIAPSDGATGESQSPTLQLSVSDPAGGSLNVSVALRKAAAPEFTIIALPDTQHYSEAFPAVFTSQTQWIVNSKESRNIVFVTHEGDIVEHNSNTTEWQRANTSMSLLDGVVPYGMGPGNHDLPTTLFNQYFPYTRYQGLPWYGGHYQNLNDNNYQLFSAGGMDFVIVHMIFCPPADAVAWADSVFKSYPDRIGIMTTHAYLGLGAVRSTHVCGSTQYLWDSLAVPNPNLQFMLSGHVHGEARRTDVVSGRTVFQMLADYQDRASGGEGWLRILRFVPGDNKVYVQTYSPWLNRFETDADSEFSLDFPMADAFGTVGTQSVPSGSTVSVPLSALEPNTQYEWRATVTNAAGGVRTGPVWRFTTGAGGPSNQPPTANNQSVSTNEDTSAIVTLTASDPDGNPLTYTVSSTPAHGTLSGVAPSLIYQPANNYAGADSFTFRVNDGQVNSAVATVSITVAPQNDPPAAAGESYSVTSGTVLNVAAPGVLGNDSDIDSASLQAQIATAPAHGALTLNANGSFSYTPAAGYSGPDSFAYVATDGAAMSGQALVSITVNPAAPINQPPTANNQSVSTNEDTSSILTLTASDPDGNPLTYTVVSTPAHGTLSGSAPSLVYQPAGNYSGADFFTFRVNDGLANSNVATVSITVAPQNDPPVAVGEAYSVTSGTVLNVSAPGVLGNDSDVDSASLQAQNATAPAHGTLTLNANGSFSYTPAAGYSGPDSFAYVATDGTAMSGQALVSITVNPAGPPPPPPGLVAAYSFNEGSGTALIDRTGLGRTGTVSGATWSTAGRNGGALSFDGVNDVVTIADHSSLDLTTGMTLEAWVRPSTVSGWRTVFLKNVSGGFAYVLLAGDASSLPAGYVRTTGDLNATGSSGLAVNVWTHMALTYDGTTLRLYVGGAQVGSRAVTGSMVVTNGALTIGGSNLGAGYFQGLIDDVRIYNRALTALEIQTDMATAVTP